MARLATQGTYDIATGELRAGGQSRSYVASDNLKADALRGRAPVSPEEGIDLCAQRCILTAQSIEQRVARVGLTIACSMKDGGYLSPALRGHSVSGTLHPAHRLWASQAGPA